jgi:hypothetical protein
MSLPASSTTTRKDRLFTPAFIALAAADLASFTAAGASSTAHRPRRTAGFWSCEGTD